MTKPTAPEPKGVCRPDEALARLEGLVDVYADVVTGFLNDDEGYLRRLHEAIERDDAKAAHRTAHTLKGLAAMCGATSVAEICFQLEQQAETVTNAERREMLQQIEAEVVAARLGLASYYRRPR